MDLRRRIVSRTGFICSLFSKSDIDIRNIANQGAVTSIVTVSNPEIGPDHVLHTVPMHGPILPKANENFPVWSAINCKVPSPEPLIAAYCVPHESLVVNVNCSPGAAPVIVTV